MAIHVGVIGSGIRTPSTSPIGPRHETVAHHAAEQATSFKETDRVKVTPSAAGGRKRAVRRPLVPITLICSYGGKIVALLDAWICPIRGGGAIHRLRGGRVALPVMRACYGL